MSRAIAGRGAWFQRASRPNRWCHPCRGPRGGFCGDVRACKALYEFMSGCSRKLFETVGRHPTEVASDEIPWSSNHFHRALWHCVHECLAILFGEEAIIQCDDNASIRFRADKAADTLAEFQDGFRQGKLTEGVAAARLNRFVAA